LEEAVSTVEIPSKEHPEAEIEPSVPSETALVEEEPEEAEARIPSDMDEEAAFAWLESLAAKQGAEEAMLLEPEERREEPPEWVSEEFIDAAEEEIEREKSVEAEVETGLEIEGEPTQAVPSMAEASDEEAATIEMGEMLTEELFPQEAEAEAVEPTMEAFAEEEDLTDKEEMEEILASLEEETPSASTAEKPEEPEEKAEPLGAEPIGEVPELPDWLAGPMPRDTGELEWKPPPIRLDINKASLIELERLIGVGFRLAQQIINYRDAKGPFKRVEDLQDVPGFDPATLEVIRDHLYVTIVPETPIAEEPTPLFVPSEDIPSELTEVHTLLMDDNLEEALDKYALLINAEQHIPRLVEDLQDITERYPESLNAWQYLGDAYLRINQVQEALKSYIKAEELLR